MKTLQEKIAVMQAFADGKEIECISTKASDKWGPIQLPMWNWIDFDYRVKPAEPKVIYVNEYGTARQPAAHATKELAELSAIEGEVVRKAVKYREVIDEQEN